jgi:membrane-anchored protein YejM (alkaline phosphatase superfamily)
MVRRAFDNEIASLRSDLLHHIDNACASKVDTADMKNAIKDTSKSTIEELNNRFAQSSSDNVKQMSSVIEEIEERIRYVNMIVIANSIRGMVVKEKHERISSLENCLRACSEQYEEMHTHINDVLGLVDTVQQEIQRKIDVETVNNWIKQHTEDINKVLDSKSNQKDLANIKEEIQRKASKESIAVLEKDVQAHVKTVATLQAQFG